VECEIDDVGTGDITAVNTAAGSGLTGGAASGAANLSLMTCTANQVLKWNGGAWGCAADTNTTYTAGTGLDLVGTQFSVETPLWLIGSFAGGSIIRGTNTSTDGYGVYGEASATGAVLNYGGWFEANGDSGSGVYGRASATGAVLNYGGQFTAHGNSGRGVSGEAIATGDVTNYGGFFMAHGNSGRGVYAYADGTSGRGVNGWGNAYDFYAAGPGTDYGVASSIRWKRNIQEIDGALDKVIALRGVYFDWDEEHGGQHDMGFIAEEVGKVIPEIVGYEPDGVYATGVDYGAITPMLVQAIKEQQRQIEELKAEITELKKRLD
jgi:hypothetical protein